MNKYKKFTIWFMIIVVLVAIGYDVGIIAIGGMDASISWLVYKYSKEYLMIPVAFGFLGGHFFWPNQGK